jgi:hypothetical protein
MKVVKGTTPDRGLQAVLTELNKTGNYIETASRNGPVRRFKGPATIMWTRPQYRVSFDPIRDANPAFHLFESLWMLAGQHDVESVSYFSSQIGNFSDDGKTFHGGYGHRWANHFGYDQLDDYIIPALRANNEDRRVVLGMWDPTIDIPAAQKNGKDVPCNVIASFDAAMGDGRLHMNVYNRSNDIVWGATGANVVHFSILQEYVASACDLAVGTYEQIAANSHLYLELNEVSKRMLKAHNDDPTRDLPYFGMISPLRHKSDGTAQEWKDKFDHDIQLLMSSYTDVFNINFSTYFFKYIVKPVTYAFNCYKNDDNMENALFWLREFRAPENQESPWFRWHDWNIAMYQWLIRVCDKRNTKIEVAMNAQSSAAFSEQVKAVWKNVSLVGNEFRDTVHDLPQVAGPVRATLDPRSIQRRGLKQTIDMSQLQPIKG